MSETARCKFKCDSVKDFGEAKEVVFSPVTGGSEENKSFWKYTPTGSLTLGYINKDINFTPGQEFYIDISPAPKAAAV